MVKLLTVIGARPQLIKAGVVSSALAKHRCAFNEVLFHTGQHYDPEMSAIFINQLDLATPKYHLKPPKQSHAAIAHMSSKLESAVKKEKPDAILVYGDTNSTLLAAIVALKFQIPLAHIEAGLRSFNETMVEETNRVLTDHSALYLACPTETAVKNLNQEGVNNTNKRIVSLTGDVMYDLALSCKAQAKNLSSALRRQNQQNFALLTLHRPINVDSSATLERIIVAISDRFADQEVIFPVHPRTRRNLSHKLPANVSVIPPQGYLEALSLIQNSSMVLTDSGGLSKEAYFLEKPCVILREETEWTELLATNTTLLAGSCPNRINNAVTTLKQRALNFSNKPFGQGDASQKIADDLAKLLC